MSIQPLPQSLTAALLRTVWLMSPLVFLSPGGAFAARNLFLVLAVFLIWQRPGLVRGLARQPLAWAMAGLTLAVVLSWLPVGPKPTAVSRLGNWLIWCAGGYLAGRCQAEQKEFSHLPALLPGLAAMLSVVAALAGEATGVLASKHVWNDMGRLTLDFTAPTRLGAALALATGLAAGVLTTTANGRLRIAAGITAAGLLLSLFLTGSRGALVAGLVALVVGCLRGADRRVWFALGGILLAAVLAMGIFSRSERMAEVASRAGSLLDPGAHSEIVVTSWPSRLLIWHISWRAYQTSPLLGVGFGRFPEAYEREAQAYLATAPEIAPGVQVLPVTTNAHNLELHSLTETGPLGLAALLAVFGLTLSVGWRHPRARPAGLAALALGLSLQLNANLDFWMVGYPFFLWAGWAAGTTRPTVEGDRP